MFRSVELICHVLVLGRGDHFKLSYRHRGIRDKVDPDEVLEHELSERVGKSVGECLCDLRVYMHCNTELLRLRFEPAQPSVKLINGCSPGLDQTRTSARRTRLGEAMHNALTN